MTYVLFDIGGTNTRVACSLDHETIADSISIKTECDDFAEGIAAMAAAVERLGVRPDDVYLIAGGIRGVLSDDRTGIDNDGIITGWAGKSIARALKKYFDAPLVLENDCAVAGLGEAHFGAGKGHDIVAYHTISTGVGGVKIVQGKVEAASVGFEPGHQVLDIDRTILGEDVTPTLENLVSGAGLASRMGVSPREIPQTDVVWDELASYLAQGLRNTILYWSPEVIVLGGSMILGNPNIPLPAIRKYTVASLDGFVDCPLITTATLGDGTGLWGALALARQYEGEA
jgi:predicted NBD/HSP70 family sugar kinase